MGILRRRNRHALAAAAGRRLIRIVEDEPRAELLGDEIHFRADEKEDRLRLDVDLHALVLDDFVERLHLFGIIHRVGHAGAAAIGHADTHALILAVRLGHDFANARRGGIRQLDRLRALATRLRCVGRGLHQYMFNSSFASSLMRSGVQGGSNVMLTVTSPMPSTPSSAPFTIPGISPATGQPGAVSVMSTVTSLLSAKPIL